MATGVLRSPSETLNGFLLVLLSAVAYGTQPFFAYFAYNDGANATGLLIVRFMIASLVILLWAAKLRMAIPPRRHSSQFVLVGIGYALAAIGYYNASQYISVSLAVILMFSFPAFVVLVSMALLRERISSLKLLCLVLSVAGVAVVVGPEFSGDIRGVWWALMAAFSYGAAILYGSHKTSAAYPLQSAIVVLLSCFVVSALFGLQQAVELPRSSDGWIAAAGLAVFATILPIATFIAGSPKIGASNASIISTVEPMVAVLLALLILGEPYQLNTLLGGLLVIAGVSMLSLESRKPRIRLPDNNPESPLAP